MILSLWNSSLNKSDENILSALRRRMIRSLILSDVKFYIESLICKLTRRCRDAFFDWTGRFGGTALSYINGRSLRHGSSTDASTGSDCLRSFDVFMGDNFTQQRRSFVLRVKNRSVRVLLCCLIEAEWTWMKSGRQDGERAKLSSAVFFETWKSRQCENSSSYRMYAIVL